MIEYEETHERQVTDIITAIEVWRRAELTPFDKFLYAEIRNLSKRVEKCTASNKYLANFCGCGERHIRKTIERLQAANLLHVEYYVNLRIPGRQGRRMWTLRPWDSDPTWCDTPIPELERGGRPSMAALEVYGHPGSIWPGEGGHLWPGGAAIDGHQSLSSTVPDSSGASEVGEDVSIGDQPAVGTYTEHAREAPDCPAARLDAGQIDKTPDSGPTALMVRTPPARAHETPLSEGAALLMLPVVDGGAGFDDPATAERIAGARYIEDLYDWIEYAREQAENVAGFIIFKIGKGAELPERYYRRRQERIQSALAGGPLGDLFPPSNRSRTHPDAPKPPPKREPRPPPEDDIARLAREMRELRAREEQR